MCRHNGRIWDKSYEGDINITDHSELVYKLYARKQGSYFVIQNDYSFEEDSEQKVGGGNVPHDVPHSVPHDVPQGRDELIEFIKAQVRLNNKITRQAIAEGAGVSVKTIQRTLKEIDNLKYVGSGNSGHWELNE